MHQRQWLPMSPKLRVSWRQSAVLMATILPARLAGTLALQRNHQALLDLQVGGRASPRAVTAGKSEVGRLKSEAEPANQGSVHVFPAMPSFSAALCSGVSLVQIGVRLRSAEARRWTSTQPFATNWLQIVFSSAQSSKPLGALQREKRLQTHSDQRRLLLHAH